MRPRGAGRARLDRLLADYDVEIALAGGHLDAGSEAASVHTQVDPGLADPQPPDVEPSEPGRQDGGVQGQTTLPGLDPEPERRLEQQAQGPGGPRPGLTGPRVRGRWG